ncbi:sodium:proline symporter [Burkholderia territorii]|uniref:Sodium:proline symporter n=1 Tax=Burkholderia territorii TaxID=1503055 RepID=A0A105UXR8_9BURK|nr:hypothetical protein [Burkholderia territorii]KVV37555.1 sodium:proline symporter [Burkholderia territorii]KVX36981.1 sodium:proline symporter [Burkholderia territorii]
MRQTGAIPILRAAFCAAVCSTIIELLLWPIAGEDAIHDLLRDARLTAALVMGPSILGAPAGFDPAIMGVATAVHAMLSLAYTVVLAKMVRGLSPGAALLAGGAFGLVLYGVNLHAFTAIFPWFVAARGVITLVAHVVFGGVAAGVYCFARRVPRP